MPIVLGSSYAGPPVQSITLADSVQLDSFGRLRVSSPTTLFDSQQEYGLDTLRMWDAAASNGSPVLSYTTRSTNGSVVSGANSVGPTNADTRMTPLTVSSNNGDYAILQSRQYVRYIPGKGHLIFITGIFAPGANADVSIVLRTDTSGIPVDNIIERDSWNVDKFDGLGPSGVTLDFTKTQILVIQAQWLGVGRVIVGFDVDGNIYPAHAFKNANIQVVPYTQTFNLPVRLETRNAAGSIISRVGYFDADNGVFLETIKAQAGGTIQFVCCSVQSEGGVAVRGFTRGASNGITSIGVTTRRPILSIRNAATFNSIINRSHIELADIAFSSATNSAFWELVLGGTLTGASWASAGTDSAAERDIAATAITGGIVLSAGFSIAGSGSTRQTVSTNPDIRNPLTISKIDGLATTQIPISLVCTSFSGTSNTTAAINWFEQTI